jgi:CRISPR-associated protein Cmr4
MHLLTPLHTGASANEGNLMGIAREVHTEFPYLPSSSLRGKIRSELEQGDLAAAASKFFGQKNKHGHQPTEGEVWFADATLLFFPIASLSHHLVWITCPLWLERWSQWGHAESSKIKALAQTSRNLLKQKSALTTFKTERLFLQTAALKAEAVKQLDVTNNGFIEFYEKTGLPDFFTDRLVIVNNEDCISLVETGLQREVRIAISDETKTVDGGSFRSEEAIPPETVMFFPWGIKATKSSDEEQAGNRTKVIQKLTQCLAERLQFGGLEGLGRGWSNLTTMDLCIETLEN